MTAFQLVWLRNDLRHYDNAALHAAAQTGLPVVAVFIATPQTWQLHEMAPIKQDLIRRRVDALKQELAVLGIPLLAIESERYSDCAGILLKIAQQGAAGLYAQTEYELREQHRDQSVSRALSAIGVPCFWFDSQCVMPPGAVRSKTGDIYKIFTPFKKTWLAQLQQKGVRVLSKPAAQQAFKFDKSGLTAMQPGDNSSAAWPVAEQQVLEQLRNFCRERVQDYQQARDFPAIDGTSALSPYLAIGVVSAQQAVARLQTEADTALWQEGAGAAVWLSELIWREFYKHILVAYPQLIKHRAFQHDTEAIVWCNNEAWFAAWCEGRTGYPIVDAAMRQLNQTGWMHNRLRMITASFLVKDLQIDWRWGERYFMSKLIDGEFAANNGGWQWAASTGTDAAPYFRIFNPVTQSEKFDPKGIFLQQYLPELKGLSSKQLHWPHPLPMSVQYFRPVVDHAKARLRTLAMFKAARGESVDVSTDEPAQLAFGTSDGL
ncbi:MAG: deoxyribodipyrimidine photo-lyase [Rheinheimera sp.]|nr:deoxyribodipyrimidine photo-lyase [Rheinheimera sp.]